jgi:hypothetical protein
MKKTFIALTLLIALTSVSILQAAAPSIAQAQSPFKNIPVTGTIANGGGTFTGTLDVVRFANQNGQVVAVGRLSGTLTDALGNVIGTVTGVLVNLLVSVGNTTCEILDLELGPLDLNLLGLMVHLDRINLEITAQQGPGNLLGNLLCAIANLLNDGNPLTDIVGLLNRIIRLLG